MPENKIFIPKSVVFFKKLFTFGLKYVIINGGFLCTFVFVREIRKFLVLK